MQTEARKKPASLECMEQDHRFNEVVLPIGTAIYAQVAADWPQDNMQRIE